MVGETELSAAIAVMMAIGAVASYAFAWYSWRRATHPVSNRFALLMLADGSWALFSLLGLVSPTDALALVWRLPLLTAVVFAGIFWFLFVIDYTGDNTWLPAAAERWLVGVGVVFSLLFVLNPSGLAYSARGVARYGVLRLPYETFGPILRLQVVFNYLLVLVAFALLGRFMLRSRNLFRKQAAVIFASAAVAVSATAAFFAGLTPHPRLGLTPIFFTLQSIGVGVALYRYDFLDVEPMAAHTLLEEMVDPVIVIDDSDSLVDWNSAAEQWIDAGDDRRSLDDVTIPGLRSATMSTDGGRSNSRVAAPTANGDEPVTFDVRTTPIEDRYGIVRGRAVVLRDISEQEERKRALETQNERLEEFTGVVSHDLRNPLQVIDGKIQLARQTGDLDHLSDASDAVGRMERMLDELLTLAREGQTIAETESVALPGCCRTAWSGVGTDDATLVVDTDRTVEADAARLQRLFENLFRNSVEHAGPEVTVTVGDTVAGFYVADDGPGIPADQQNSVFEFGTTFAEEGTGFGLAIVESITAAHGWSTTVGDSESGGARFDVSLTDHEHLPFDDSPLGHEP